MMVIDTSALVAMLIGEPDAASFVERILENDVVVGAPTIVEFMTVALGKGYSIGRVEELVLKLRLRVVPFGHGEARVAGVAYERFGRGRHVARLNYGDALTYAIAKLRDAPLLFKGNDFAVTDLTPA